MLIKILAFFAFSFTFALRTNAQESTQEDYKLFVHLENAPFDSLYLHDYTEGRNILIAGKKIKNFTWEISIPESIITDFETMELVVSQYDSVSKSSRAVRFIAEKDGRKTIVVNVGVEDRTNYIHGIYIGKTTLPNERILTRINNRDSLVVCNLVIEDFKLIIKDESSDVTVRAKDPFFSWFDKDMSYERQLASYLETTKKHPDSRFLMTYLALNLNQYKSKDDVKSIYETLSSKHKNTLWAKNIERFVYNQKFQNASLWTLDKSRNEFIVQDTSKHNLIIFTASWCTNCIKEIPILKEIHKDLGKNLNLIFVSIDDIQGVEPFQKLVEEKHIPWRSLLAYENLKKVKQQYFIEGIPLNLLIHPNGDMEKIDVRIDEHRSKLYSLLRSKVN